MSVCRRNSFSQQGGNVFDIQSGCVKAAACDWNQKPGEHRIETARVETQRYQGAQTTYALVSSMNEC